MITAYGEVQTRERALEEGAAGLLTNPIDFDALRAEIDHRLASLTSYPADTTR